MTREVLEEAVESIREMAKALFIREMAKALFEATITDGISKREKAKREKAKQYLNALDIAEYAISKLSKEEA